MTWTYKCKCRPEGTPPEEAVFVEAPSIAEAAAEFIRHRDEANPSTQRTEAAVVLVICDMTGWRRFVVRSSVQYMATEEPAGG